MLNQFSRTELLIGKEGIKKLENAKVAVFGIGGVGGYTVEALVRGGVGAIDIIDDDKVCVTNINRQLIATTKTIGKYKVNVMKERILEINPKAIVNTYQCFYLPENAHEFNLTQYDYIVDAVDTVTAKIEIIMRAKESGKPVISCMGAGNRLDAGKVVVADIYKTQTDPLARVMRRELRKRQVKSLKVVTSTEAPTRPSEDMALSCRDKCICPPDVERKCVERRGIPGSISYVPAVAGMLLASEVIRDLLGLAKIATTGFTSEL
jgi:tRNA A37 threonylcarbamoyladenosine dehydratase